MVQRIGAADSATPHPDPSGGQAPALHFLIPPSTIGLQFGTFRRWRAGIEIDWRAHIRTNDEVGEAGRLDRHYCLYVAGREGVHVREDQVAGEMQVVQALRAMPTGLFP